jgi:ABC-type branched-subunit amino acid transport system permease subunit
VRPVYGQHLKQILITMGGMIIGEELIKAIWGPQQISLPLPQSLRGSWLFGDAAIEKYRVLAVIVGVTVFVAMLWVLSRTKVGLLIRAGVQDREMVESLGYRIRRLFVGVFVAGSALAGLGGVMWGLYQQNVTAQMGSQVNVLIFIVIIIGGLGSAGGCFIGAMLVGLMANYTGFLAPKVAHVLEHPADGDGAAVAPAGPVLGGAPMIRSLLSADLPRSRLVTLLLLGVVFVLALAPFLLPGTKALNVAAKILVFVLLVASYDLLLGYTGIVSFAHTMFFGIGAYGVAIASSRLAPSWTALLVGSVGALLVSALLALVIGLFSLRVRAIFFAMITLAVATAFQTLASQLSELTGGEDGITFKLPEVLQPAFTLREEPLLGAALDGRFAHLLPALLRRQRTVPDAAAGGQLAVWPRAAGDPRERLPRRGARLSHGDLSHLVQCDRGALCDPGRCAAGHLAALQRTRYLAVVRDHARHPADRRDRRHGNPVRRDHRQRAVRDRAELPAGPAQCRGQPGSGCPGAVGAAVGRPLAALARAAVRAVGVLLPHGNRRTAAPGQRKGQPRTGCAIEGPP